MVGRKIVFGISAFVVFAGIAYLQMSAAHLDAGQVKAVPPAALQKDHPVAPMTDALARDKVPTAPKVRSTAPSQIAKTASFSRPAGPLRMLIPELKRRALAADSGAAYFLAAELLECKHGNLDIDDSPPDAVEVIISRVKRDCSGVDPADIADYPKWLQIAADLGSAKAKRDYINVIDNVMTPTDMIRSPELVAEYKNRAIFYLKGQAEVGDLGAISLLENVYANGVLAPQNYFLAYAHHFAICRFNNSNSPIDQRILDEYASHMTPRDVQRAQDLGIEIAANAKVID